MVPDNCKSTLVGQKHRMDKWDRMVLEWFYCFYFVVNLFGSFIRISLVDSEA